MVKFYRALFCTAIQTRMQESDLSLRETAKVIGISARALSRLVNGEAPDIETFAAVVAWLRIDVNEFLLDAEAEGEEYKQVGETALTWTSLLLDLRELGIKEEMIKANMHMLRLIVRQQKERETT